MKATKSMGKGKADAVEASGLSDYIYSTFRGSERDCAFATTTREESSSLACQSHTKLNTNNVWLGVRPRQPIYIDTPTCSNAVSVGADKQKSKNNHCPEHFQ